MDFTQRKLPKEAADRLRTCAIETVKPCALMMAPAYVYMRLNEKYVMVKGALDFFDAEELDRLKPMKAFFFPEEVDKALLFRRVAADVRSLLTLQTEGISPTDPNRVMLAPASYETTDAILRLISSLWELSSGDTPSIDPFFVAVFTNELCELLPGETLKALRDRDIARFERAIVGSGWAVFIALHLGYSDLAFLNRIRKRVFDEIADDVAIETPGTEVGELIQAARQSLGDIIQAVPGDIVTTESLSENYGRASMKLVSRFDRIRKKLAANAGAGGGDV